MDISIDCVKAFKFSSRHRRLLINDKVCGCFFCMKIFAPEEICHWIDDPGGTAICPHCGIDSIIGESSGYPMTTEFILKMNQHWFR